MEALIVRWVLVHLSRLFVGLNRRLLEWTRVVLEERRDHILGGFLTRLSLLLVGWNTKLVAVNERLRNHS